MDQNGYYPNQYQYQSFTPQVSLNQYLSRTFGWMFLGLLVTFLTGVVLCSTNLVFVLFTIPFMLPVITILELGLVIAFSASLLKRSVSVTRTLFFVYAVVNGVFFSVYMVLFEMTSLILIFGLTSLFFGAFALYGKYTKTDLSPLRPLLIGGLIFLLITGIVSLFLNISGLERLICMVGILVFLCFTAYDTQKIKANYDYFSGNAVMLEKASIYSALQLYLDFINLFLYLLRFLGRARNN